jgi:hypothetical protein
MMLYRALLVLLVTLSGAVASEISLRGGEEDSSEVTSTNNRDSRGKPDRVPICQKRGKRYTLTTLAPVYRLPGDLLPAPFEHGYTLNETCQIVLSDCPCFTADYFRLVSSIGFPHTCINDAPIFVELTTAHGEGGCSGYNCGSPPWTPGAPDKLSCDFRPDAGPVHFHRITAAENEACQAIIIGEMLHCV